LIGAQIAVAKHLGLMTLRLTDAIILPLNTTQYVLDLHKYLDQWVLSCFGALPEHSFSSWIDRVEKIASIASIGHNFIDLRKAISSLQSASALLDNEKEEAEKAFKVLLHKLSKKHVSCRHIYFRQMVDWLKKFFGLPPRHGEGDGHSKAGYWMDVAFGKVEIETVDMHKQQSRRHHPHHEPPGCPIHKLVKAAKRVRRANQKLVAFERGFISKEGIRNREWYKHLGVAPGLWLGQSSLL